MAKRARPLWKAAEWNAHLTPRTIEDMHLGMFVLGVAGFEGGGVTPPALLPVTSCFGGLALYSLPRLRASGCTYDERGTECEHVRFTQCLEAAFNGSVFLDTAMRVYYDAASHAADRAQPRAQPHAQPQALARELQAPAPAPSGRADEGAAPPTPLAASRRLHSSLAVTAPSHVPAAAPPLAECDVAAALSALAAPGCMEHRSYADGPLPGVVADDEEQKGEAVRMAMLSSGGLCDGCNRSLPILITHYPPLSGRRATLEARLRYLRASDVTWIKCANREDFTWITS